MEIFRLFIALGIFNVFSSDYNKNVDNTAFNQLSSLIENEAENSLKTISQENLNEVMFDLETSPVNTVSLDNGNVTPAIWRNANSPENSLILSTNNYTGIYVYNLEGKLLQYRGVGKIHNIDLKDDFELDNENVVLVAASNKSNNCISIFYIDKLNTYLSDVILDIKTDIDEIGNVCMYRNLIDNKFYVFACGENGNIEQWQVFYFNGELETLKIRSIETPNGVLGIVASDLSNKVYISVEDEGIYNLVADPYVKSDLNKVSYNNLSTINKLAIFSYKQKEYFLASTNSSNSFVILNVNNDEKQSKNFTLSEKIAGSFEEIQGADIISAPLNDKFPSGILVQQEIHKGDSTSQNQQITKYVSFDKVKKFIEY